MAERDLGRALLAIARSSIGAQFGLGAIAEVSHPALAKHGATFVTLRKDGELRGCIGSLEPRRPLGDDVRENALAAAFRDPRFPPLTRMEFGRTPIEVSLLSAAERLEVTRRRRPARAAAPRRSTAWSSSSADIARRSCRRSGRRCRTRASSWRR